MAAKRAFPPGATVTWSGAMVIETAGGVAVTMTSAVADFDGSAFAVATIHPSAVLRSHNRDEAFAGLVADLAVAARALAG